MAEKLKFAFYWAASCGGCEIAVLDINEKILDVVGIADIVFWPVAMDIKYHHVESFPDKHIDVCFFNGSVRTEEQEHLAKLLRRKSKTLVAFGACAHMGSVPGLANLSSRAEVFETAYHWSPSTINTDHKEPQTRFSAPEGELTLPAFYDTVKTLDQTVDVDYYLPGCPPPPELIVQAVEAIASGTLPEKGTVLAPTKSLCDECERRTEELKKITEIKRPYQIVADPKKCFLEQGIICYGPATRAGCNARCIKGNFPCTGCMGPTPGVLDQGAKMMGALTSILGLDGEDRMSDADVQKLIDQIEDPIGTFYMYSLPGSLLRRKVLRGEKSDD